MTYPDDFNQFWKLWPGRWQPENERAKKVGKYDAFLEWKKLGTDDKGKIMGLMKSGRVKDAGTQYIPDACRWLKRRYWDDFE